MESNETIGSSLSRIKVIFAITLLLLGIAGLSWIANGLYQLTFSSPVEVPIINHFVLLGDAARSIGTKDGDVILPSGLFFFFSFFVYIFVMGITAGLVKVLIKSGAHLLDHELSSTLRKFKEEVESFKKRINQQAS